MLITNASTPSNNEAAKSEETTRHLIDDNAQIFDANRKSKSNDEIEIEKDLLSDKENSPEKMDVDIEKNDAEMIKKDEFENKPIKIEVAETTTEPHLQVQNPTEINQNDPYDQCDKLPGCNIKQPAGESSVSVNSASTTTDPNDSSNTIKSEKVEEQTILEKHYVKPKKVNFSHKVFYILLRNNGLLLIGQKKLKSKFRQRSCSEGSD